MRRVAFLGLLMAASCLPAQDAPRLLVGPKLLEAFGGREVATIREDRFRAASAFSSWAGEHRYVLAETTVDARTGEALEQSGRTLRLLSPAREPIWAVDDLAFAGALPQGRLLLRDYVIVPAEGGGLIALDRRDGSVLWRQAELPGRLLVADGDLVFAVGAVGDRIVLAGLASRNGARAFVADLTEAPRRLVPASHGLAVTFAKSVAVYDRAGPELFRLDVVAEDIVGGTGWFVRTKAELLTFDRRGRLLWRCDPVVDDLDTLRLSVTADGRLLVARWCAFADSGVAVTCHDAASGELRWTHRAPGLGVDHTKYRHQIDVRALGDSVLVVSQGSSGAFVIELDVADGSLKVRHAVDR